MKGLCYLSTLSLRHIFVSFSCVVERGLYYSTLWHYVSVSGMAVKGCLNQHSNTSEIFVSACGNSVARKELYYSPL